MSILPQVTLVTTFKPQTGVFQYLQENALCSWLALKPQPEVLIVGESAGVDRLAKKYGVRYIRNVRTTPSGVPLVNDIFNLAIKQGKYDLICYLNGDMVLGQDFLVTLGHVDARTDDYLLLGRRLDVDIPAPVGQAMLTSPESLCRLAASYGRLHSYDGIDYFVFRRNFWDNIPDLAIARTRWDNWMIHNALSRGKKVVDCTRGIKAIHQNHDYSSIPGGLDGKIFLREAGANEKITANAFASIVDANYLFFAGICWRLPNIIVHLRKQLWYYTKILQSFSARK